ncbi:RNA polymerase sigma factor [Criibacterium bergeronii]|uniref:Sigma-70 family RNA polymerase sigma factor n=1 Tax=Criibacterium bergeronii TaxID=1871336 RepID=A0A371IKF0_9FIRM|nr:sigma-70 family RNA polymerase sigma factor [Criibacterium bergeronii]MBS6063853.1 sigma-70 family RNA polymerase sigma factor [Peptostreptococcaceae bacterium]RDY20943.1 sigma-70 family RNA polymerase sigma factor [Criibacterium bergeronii]
MNKNELFKKLMQNREKDLYKIAYSYMKNENDAMDVVQDTLLKGLEKFDYLEKKEYFDTWIIRILINTCKDTLKKRKMNLTIDDQDFTLTLQEKDTEGVIDLIKTLDLLNDEERELINLKYFQNKKLSEISEIKGVKIGTVKSRLSRTLDKLKENLA